MNKTEVAEFFTEERVPFLPVPRDLLTASGDWDPEKHPRNEKGQFDEIGSSKPDEGPAGTHIPEPKLDLPGPAGASGYEGTPRMGPDNHDEPARAGSVGQWRELSPDERHADQVNRLAEVIARTGGPLTSDEVRARAERYVTLGKGLNPTEEKVQEGTGAARTFILDGVAADGTPVSSRLDIDKGVRISAARVEELQSTITQLRQTFPDRPVSYRLIGTRMADSITRGRSDRVWGLTRRGISPILLTPFGVSPRGEEKYRDYFRRGSDSYQPEGAKVSALTYATVHEYGHALDTRASQPRSPETQRALDSVRSGSGYGRSSESEGFAESFAAWHLSGGTTSDPLAQALAKSEGWPRAQVTAAFAVAGGWVVFDWDPEKHPRDEKGRFGEAGGDDRTQSLHDDLTSDPAKLAAGMLQQGDRLLGLSTKETSGSGSQAQDKASALKASVAEALATNMKSDTNAMWMATHPYPLTGMLGNPDYVVVSEERGFPYVAKASELTPMDTVGARTARADTPEGEQMLREEAAGRLVQLWAGSANDMSIQALALQESAIQEFRLKGTMGWDMRDSLQEQVDDDVVASGPVYRDFLRTQYDQTQAFLAREGVTEVTVARGWNWEGRTPPDWARGQGPPTVATIASRPLSAWTTRATTARGFAHDDGAVGFQRVPAERVLSCPKTGVGCLYEREFVLLGGQDRVVVSKHVGEPRGLLVASRRVI